MSLLDRAFVKAYTRSHSTSPSSSSVNAPHHRQGSSALPASVDLPPIVAPIPDAVAWIEMADESYFRVDVGHSQSPRRTASTPVPASSQANLNRTAVPRSEPVVVSDHQTVPVPQGTSPLRNSSGWPAQSLPVQSLPTGPSPAHATPVHPWSAPARPSQSMRVSPTVISHTLTAYELPSQHAKTYSQVTHPSVARPTVQEAQVEQVRMRIDDSHLLRTHLEPPKSAPRFEEQEVFFRSNRDQEQAEAFARAKMEALAKEEAAKNIPPVVAAQTPVATENLPLAVATPLVSTASSAATPNVTTPTPRAFEPVWEVDAYEYPETIVELFGDAKLMTSIGSPLDHAVANGLRSLLVTSVDRGVGRTSVAVGIAVSAATAGLRVVLVDADTLTAGLGQTLGLEAEFGWLEAIQGNVPLEEVAIRSIEDQFIVVPSLANASRPKVIGEEFDKMMSQLRDSFDLIVVDGAPWAATSLALQQSTAIDAAIVVVDARNRDAERMSWIQNDLRRVGVAGLGIVENFA